MLRKIPHVTQVKIMVVMVQEFQIPMTDISFNQDRHLIPRSLRMHHCNWKTNVMKGNLRYLVESDYRFSGSTYNDTISIESKMNPKQLARVG